MNNSLFGDEFEITFKPPKVKDVIKKVNEQPKEENKSVDKILKSKKIELNDRLAVIKENVLKTLGKQKNNIVVIKDINTFHNYITNAIKAGRIAIDTETNNSLDPVTCKIAGLCLYYPGGKQAYIPINHRDPDTKEHLSWQVTEIDCKNELQRVIDAKTMVIMHNGKFDYEVIKCTCGIAVKPDWDTMVAARLLNENELAGLKWQYINKIDPDQEKYSIENLFEHVSYLDVDPDVFAYYAATDSLMTDKLYELQAKEFDKPEYGSHLDISGKHTVNGLRWLFHEVEMPIVVITAEMELTGVAVDCNLGEKLKIKYTNQLNNTDNKITEALKSVDKIIAVWKLSKEANERTRTYVAKKTKMTAEKINASYPEIDENGNKFKYGKAKVDQLSDPINLASPTQLAILFYDILGAPLPEKDSRATGEEELNTIKDKLDKILDVNATKKISEADRIKFEAASKLCNLILDRRGIMKLLTTYIDVIPELVKHWPDGRIRFHLNPIGADTGRYSSGGKLKFMENEEEVEVSGINIQNIPSHCPEIRLLFKGDTIAKLVEAGDNEPFIINEISEVETTTGWFLCENLKVGDLILVDGAPMPIKSINYLTDLRQYSIEV